MLNSPPSRGEQTRAAILHAAHNLFIKQGYHGTSMRQIARDAELALGGLYNHFHSKEAVFEAVFLAFHPYQQVFPAIQSAQGENLQELVLNAVYRMVRAVEDHPDYMNLMFIEMVEFKSIHAQQLFTSLFPQGLQILQHLVGTYPEQMRPIPTPMIVRTFIGLFFGYYLTEIAMAPVSPREFREDALRYFVDVYLNGILVQRDSQRMLSDGKV